LARVTKTRNIVSIDEAELEDLARVDFSSKCSDLAELGQGSEVHGAISLKVPTPQFVSMGCIICKKNYKKYAEYAEYVDFRYAEYAKKYAEYATKYAKYVI
jgi:hypothetical protein